MHTVYLGTWYITTLQAQHTKVQDPVLPACVLWHQNWNNYSILAGSVHLGWKIKMNERKLGKEYKLFLCTKVCQAHPTCVVCPHCCSSPGHTSWPVQSFPPTWKYFGLSEEQSKLGRPLRIQNMTFLNRNITAQNWNITSLNHNITSLNWNITSLNQNLTSLNWNKYIWKRDVGVLNFTGSS